MNGPKNLSKSLYQKDRPFRAILDFAEKFQIFGILRLSNKFEDLKISSHFILLLNTSSKTICRKKNFGPISVEICCPEKMALKISEHIESFHEKDVDNVLGENPKSFKMHTKPRLVSEKRLKTLF